MRGASEVSRTTANCDEPIASRQAVLACMVSLGYVPPGGVTPRPFWQEYGLVVAAAVVGLALGLIACMSSRNRRAQGSKPK